MIMSEADICLEYRQAKKPYEQIPILAELNLCSREQIMRILIRNGMDMSNAVYHRNARARAALEHAMMLELEAAASAAKAAVKRYEKVLESIEKTGGKKKP